MRVDWFKKHPPAQPKTVWTEPIAELTYAEFVYHMCYQVKLDMEKHNQEYCMAVTEQTWRKIIHDKQLRLDLRFENLEFQKWSGEMAVLYGVRIVVLKPGEQYLPDGAVPTDIENWNHEYPQDWMVKGPGYWYPQHERHSEARRRINQLHLKDLPTTRIACGDRELYEASDGSVWEVFAGTAWERLPTGEPYDPGWADWRRT
jgi:hypothetical protein